MLTPTGTDLDLRAKLFRGLADRSRLAILEALRNGPKSVGEVVEITGLSQPNTSMHLDCLYCCGLADRKREGRRVIYRIRSGSTMKLLQAAEKALSEVADHIRACERYEA
jgi:DNA-binding transcriptional ArsR family regulator